VANKKRNDVGSENKYLSGADI